MATALNNIATLNAQYDNVAFDSQSANVMAQLLDMSVAITANPMVWAGRELTYTVIVTNNDTVLPLTDLVLTDMLDPALITFVDGSVVVGGTAAPAADVTYNATSGLLTVQIPNIAVETTTNITFRVTKK